MIRLIWFFILALVCTFGIWWAGNLPGTATLDLGRYQIEAQLGVVYALLVLLAVGSIIVWWIIRTVFQIPKFSVQFFRQRRRDRGYLALSQGLISLGAGDAQSARKFGLTAEKLLQSEPAVQMLLAQTAQMTGSLDEARNRFETLIQDKKTKLLGLHGLFVEATRQREPIAALHYAEEAVTQSPKIPWAASAVLDIHIASQDWEKALQSLENSYRYKLLDKTGYRRKKAVMLTALAMEIEQGEPDRALKLALEANSLDHSLIPTAVLASRLQIRMGKVRKAVKILEETWNLCPHPEIAQAYAHAIPGDSVQDRLKRVKKLAEMKPDESEGALILAQTAVEAQEFKLAREQLEKVLESDPTQRAFLLMAELEEKESNDLGLSRQWLSRAINAPRDSIWVADGVEYESWQPVSPTSKKLDSFIWQRPRNAVQDVIGESDEPLSDLRELRDDSERTDSDSQPGNGEMDERKSIDEIKQNVDSDKGTAGGSNPSSFQNGNHKIIEEESGTTKHSETTDGNFNDGMEKEVMSEKVPPDTTIESKETPPNLKMVKSDTSETPSPVNFPLKHAPDDPGTADQKLSS